ncbi:hypothetical protein JHK87_050593 [Glycine soja]|nr:hypothetical protein JHK87_050593 [Glycine soja]
MELCEGEELFDHIVARGHYTEHAAAPAVTKTIVEVVQAEHRVVAEFVASDSIFGQVGNVWVLGKLNLVTYRGPTMLGTTLHAMAMLLRTCQWDWFINISVSDYPLVTQDGMIVKVRNEHLDDMPICRMELNSHLESEECCIQATRTCS